LKVVGEFMQRMRSERPLPPDHARASRPTLGRRLWLGLARV